MVYCLLNAPVLSGPTDVCCSTADDASAVQQWCTTFITHKHVYGICRAASSPVCPQRPFGTVWASSSHEPGSPVIKFNTSLAPMWLLAQDTGRQVRAGNPLPGATHMGSCQVPAAAPAPTQETAAVPSIGAPLYQPPVDLAVLGSQLQRLGPSTPLRYTAHHYASSHQQQQHREYLLQQPLLSPPGKAGAAAPASGGNAHWAADAGTQTVPHWLAADAVRLGEPLLHWGSSCCSAAAHHQHRRSAGGCRSSMHWQEQDGVAQQQQHMHHSVRPGRPWTAADASTGAPTHAQYQYAAGMAARGQTSPQSAAGPAEGVPYTAFSRGLSGAFSDSRSRSCSSSPWRFARPGQLQPRAAAWCASEPWVPPGTAAAKATAMAAEAGCCCFCNCTSSGTGNMFHQPAAAVAPTSPAAALRSSFFDPGSCRGSAARSIIAGGQLQHTAASSNRRRAGSPVSRRQAAEAARARARQQLEVSAKYAAIGRAAAAETAAAQEAARKEQARVAAVTALQDETDSEHDVDVIITTSPHKKGNRHSNLRTSAEAVSAAAIAARAAALRNNNTSNPARVQYLPESVMASELGTGSTKRSSNHSTAFGSSPSRSSTSTHPKSQRELMNRQKQTAPVQGKHGKPAAALGLQRHSNSTAAGSSRGSATRQTAAASSKVAGMTKSSSKRQPSKPAADLWLGHAVTPASAACAAAGSDQQVCGTVPGEPAAAAGEGTTAARSSKQALLDRLLAEWSGADQLPSCSSKESWALPAGTEEEEQQQHAGTAHAGHQLHWFKPSCVSTQPGASTLGQKMATAWTPAAATPAGCGAFMPLLQQPEVELAAGSSIYSPQALSAEQMLHRAARLAAFIHSCSSSNGGVALAGAKQSLLFQQEMPQQDGRQQGWVAERLQDNNDNAGMIGSSSIVVCTGASESAAPPAATSPAVLAADASAAEQAIPTAASAALSAVSLSCQGSQQADLAVADDEHARLHSLLASSRSSIYSHRSSTVDLACIDEAFGCAGVPAVSDAEAPCFVDEEAAEAAACSCFLVADDGISRDAAAGSGMYDNNGHTLSEQHGLAAANQLQQQQQQQQLDLVPLQAAVQLAMQEPSTVELLPAEAATAAAELAAAVLLDNESSTASLAEFELEIAALLSHSGANVAGSSSAAGGSSSAIAATRYNSTL
ncbi:hypothetical protein COO60DRAFT_1234529 [Scenedesmus sp. NREL 46B-D3]|nr:hypothetical protein COO60DRAFT_1234529 [Scenedesmus sp. NREL 46B-D3]